MQKKCEVRFVCVQLEGCDDQSNTVFDMKKVRVGCLENVAHFPTRSNNWRIRHGN